MVVVGTFDPVIVSPTDGGGGGGGGGGGVNPPKPTIPDYTKPPTTPKKPLDGECFCVRGTPGQGVKGGLYGAARNGNRKHQGIDLGVNIGKPVYAAFSGTITKLVTTQPNRVPKGQRTELHNKDTGYPLTYNGDDNSAGNRIRIYSDINGTKFETTYMHLNQGNRHNLKNGGRVNAGDVIGYTGISGNSYPNSPVLHLQTNKDRNYGQHFDPAIFFPFINKTGTCGSPNCINKK